MKYKAFWKYEFEKILNSLVKKEMIIGWHETAKELQDIEIPIWEYVYRIKLKNRAASIIVYSSIDKQTDRSRRSGKDAVRIIYEWHTKNGLIYSKIVNRNRIESLFGNMRHSIIKASNECFDLGKRSFGTLNDALTKK